MESVLAMLSTLFVLLAIIAFVKWHEYTQEKKLRDLVSWSAIGDYSPSLGRNSYVRELLFAVLNAQYNEDIDEKYRITEEEKQYVIEIIEDYQRDIMRSYFKGQNIVIKSKYVISGKDYFMLMLYTFLSEHQCDYDFLGHDMHKERVSYKSYGSSITAGFDATYALTDFSVVFHKMYYIAYMYCRRSDSLRKYIPEWNENNIKEILDTNQIQLSQY